MLIYSVSLIYVDLIKLINISVDNNKAKLVFGQV